MSADQNPQDFDADLRRVQAELATYSSTLTSFSPGDLILSTITVTTETNVAYVDVDDPEVYTPYLHECMEVRKPMGKRGRFRNSIIFQFNDLVTDHEEKERLSVMLFSTGNMTIAGCKSVADGVTASKAVCSLLDNKAGRTPGLTKIGGWRVEMINTNFTTGSGLHLHRLHTIMVNHYKYDARFDKEVHPGIVWNFATSYAHKRFITIAIFSTGSVVMTGIVDPSQLKEAYVAVTQLLNTHFADVSRAGAGDDDDGELQKPERAKRGRKCQSERNEMQALLAGLARVQ